MNTGKAHCRCGGEMTLKGGSSLVCLECGAEAPEAELAVDQPVTVAGIKGPCRVLYLPRTPDEDGDLVAAVEDELGGTHTVKRALCQAAEEETT